MAADRQQGQDRIQPGPAMSILHPEWPSDLPHRCPHCCKPFEPHIHLVVGPGKTARFLLGMAWGMVVPWVAIATLIGFASGIVLQGRGGGQFLLVAMFVPPTLVYFSHFLFPLSRRVICTACDWRGEFPAPIASPPDLSARAEKNQTIPPKRSVLVKLTPNSDLTDVHAIPPSRHRLRLFPGLLPRPRLVFQPRRQPPPIPDGHR